MIFTLLHRVASWMYRRPSPGSMAARNLAYAASLLLLAIVGGAFVSALAFVGRAHLQAFRHLAPAIPVERPMWHMAYDKSGDLPPPDLWQSAARLSDDDHQANLRHLAEQQGGGYAWAGLRIDPASIKELQDHAANHFILGYVNAPWTLWLNDDVLATGDASTQAPIVVALPLTWIAREGRLEIALRVAVGPATNAPFLLSIDRQGGFATAEAADNFRYVEFFESQLRPWALVAAYALLGCFSFLIWRQNPTRREMLYTTTYAVMHALIQVMRADFAYATFEFELLNRLQIPLLIIEGGAGLLFVLALARVRPEFFTAIIPTFAAAAALSPFVVTSADSVVSVTRGLQTWLLPCCYLAGALACLLQGVHLLTYRADSSLNRARGTRLLQFAAGFVVLAACYWTEADTVGAADAYSEWFRFGNITLVIAVFWFTLRDFRELDRLASSSPVSRYHRLPRLPEHLSGTLFLIDIKNSQAMFERDAKVAVEKQLVIALVGQMMNSAMRAGATIIQSEGDSLLAFIEDRGEGQSVARSCAALARLADDLTTIYRQITATDATEATVCFRAAVAHGSVRPIWQDVGGTRFASWTSVGDANVFVEVARLIEVERNLPGAAAGSQIIMTKATASGIREVRIPGFAWSHLEVDLADKHGNIHTVAVLAAEPDAMDQIRPVA